MSYKLAVILINCGIFDFLHFSLTADHVCTDSLCIPNQGRALQSVISFPISKLLHLTRYHLFFLYKYYRQKTYYA